MNTPDAAVSVPLARPAAAPDFTPRLPAVRRALLFGNFATGCGVMVVAGAINDMSASLQVSVAQIGRLLAIGAIVVGVGAPLLAGWVSGFDRRRLLAWSLVWYGVGHLLCLLTASYPALWPLRAVTMLAAAVFTPQAAAAIGFMAPPEQRGRSITFVFLGWSIASVFGMPLSAWLGDTFGWRTAFGAVAVLSLVAAGWVFAVMPDRVRPAALSFEAWKRVFADPVLMAMVSVTALQSSGVFTLFPYFAPYYKHVLHASTEQIALLFAWYGLFGFIGNLVLSRTIDRVGAGRTVAVVLCLSASMQLLWPLATTFALTLLVLLPGGLGFFAVNSGQQARLGAAAPQLAPALMALNTSAIYVGQAVGATGGSWLFERQGFAPLHWVGFAWIALGVGVSLWVSRRMSSRPRTA